MCICLNTNNVYLGGVVLLCSVDATLKILPRVLNKSRHFFRLYTRSSHSFYFTHWFITFLMHIVLIPFDLTMLTLLCTSLCILLFFQLVFGSSSSSSFLLYCFSFHIFWRRRRKTHTHTHWTSGRKEKRDLCI